MSLAWIQQSSIYCRLLYYKNANTNTNANTYNEELTLVKMIISVGDPFFVLSPLYIPSSIGDSGGCHDGYLLYLFPTQWGDFFTNAACPPYWLFLFSFLSLHRRGWIYFFCLFLFWWTSLSFFLQNFSQIIFFSLLSLLTSFIEELLKTLKYGKGVSKVWELAFSLLTPKNYWSQHIWRILKTLWR